MILEVGVRCRALLVSALGLVLGCAAAPPEGVVVEPVTPSLAMAPLDFELVAVDGSPVTSEGTRSRNTVFVFVATYDLASLAQVQSLGRTLREHRPRVNGVVIALDPLQNRALVEAFASKLAFPVVHADAALRSGRGGLPVGNGVPSVLILDREGRPRFRYQGFAEPSVIERALKPLD